MNLQFLGAAHTVTGSCYLLEANDHKVLIDCGMFQGARNLRDLNYNDFRFVPSDIDCVLLTHAHVDHCGLIPKLCKQGFKGDIYATKATCDLVNIMLPDSAHIQESDAQITNRKGQRMGKTPIAPLYTIDDAMASLKQFVPIDYDQEINPVNGIRAIYKDAGHIMGSAIIEVYVTENGEETKIVFTGDLGQPDQPIIKDPTHIKEADYLVIESTYGDRKHQIYDKETPLAEIINDTMDRGGNLIIPSFAVGRTQTMLYYLFKLWKANRIEDYSVVVDSPLAVEATRIFAKNTKYFDVEATEYIRKHGKLPQMPQLRLCESANESKALNTEESSHIILSASGMADAGRVLHHLKHNLWRPESTILFVGYQAEGSLGRRLLEGAKKVKVLGEEISVKARIVNMDGFSAHADYSQMEEWLQHLTMYNAKQVFVVHGEATASKAVKEMIEEEFGWNAYIPFYADRAIMTKNTCEIKAANIPQVSVEKDMEDFFVGVDADYRQLRRRIINLVVKNPELMPAAMNTIQKGWRYVKRLFKDFGIS